MEILTLLAAYPLGDDTPILFYAIIGITALGLLIATVLMGKKSGGNDKDKKK